MGQHVRSGQSEGPANVNSGNWPIWIHVNHLASTLTAENPGIRHSVLKLVTGFVRAAFIARKLTVSSAISSAITAAAANTHHEI